MWSLDNRTAGFRILGDGPNSMRSGCRVPGADVNPSSRLRRRARPRPPRHREQAEARARLPGQRLRRQEHPEVPKCLRDALTLLDKSKILRSAFGDDVIDHYLHAGEWEQQEFDRRVTDYERVRMFERG